MFLENGKEEVVLGITIDNKLTFDSHVKSICQKAVQKLIYFLEYHHTLKQIKTDGYLKVWRNHKLVIAL